MPARVKPNPKAASSTAARFARTRGAHESELGEDYVEAIAQLQAQSGSRDGARVKDLAVLMGVSHVTVVRTIARLVAKGLVETSRGKPVTLTPAGKRLAEKSQARHEAVLAFLLKIGVSPKQAEIDAEGIEHHVSEETIRIMRRLTDQ